MTRPAITPTDKGRPLPESWRITNPAYEYTPPRVSACGRWVELDGGTLADYQQMLRDFKVKA